MPSDKRRVQRLAIDPPISASLGGVTARLLDLSVDGAGLEHDAPILSGRPTTLTFTYGDETITLEAITVRCRLENARNGGGFVFRSGIRFTEVNAARVKALRSVVHALLLPELEAARNAVAQALVVA